MAVVSPFRALRPEPRAAAAVAAVPYDVVSTEEARALAADVPLSFLHVTRPEIALAPGTAPHDPAEFPDSVTARGTKHLGELAEVVRQGGRAVMFYLVQRGDCRRFAIAVDIDPRYAEAFAGAVAAGVEIFCNACRGTPDEITLSKPLATA